MGKTNRKEVYAALDSERNYQDIRWQGSKSSKENSTNRDALDRTLDEYVLYIKGYADDLATIASHTDDPTEKLNFIRKVGGLCVSAMEAHGAPMREIPELV